MNVGVPLLNLIEGISAAESYSAKENFNIFRTNSFPDQAGVKFWYVLYLVCISFSRSDDSGRGDDRSPDVR